MTLHDTARIALVALGQNKLRSCLTALGIIIGVGSLIALLAIGQGARSQVAARVASLGENVIQVTAGSLSRSAVKLGLGTSIGLSLQDAQAIRDEIPGAVAVSPEVKVKSQVVSGNRNWSPDVYGDSAEYFVIRRWAASQGQLFTEQDERASAKVAVIGQEVVEELFLEEDDPVGQVIRIRNVPFIVIGVLAPKGASASGSDQDDSIIVPYTTALKQLVRKETGLRRIYVQAASLRELPAVEEGVVRLLRQRHDIDDTSEDDFKVRSQLEIAQSATATARTMTLLLSLIASVSLIVGGIGIMNIMLVSVTERTREIGIRLAIGARRRDIRRQFLIEAVLLSALGGLLGVAGGAGTARLLTAIADWPTVVSPDAIVLACAFSALVGVFFGFYPARKASRLDPIESLRYE